MGVPDACTAGLCLLPGMYTVVYRHVNWLALSAARVQKHLLTKGTAGKRPETF